MEMHITLQTETYTGFLQEVIRPLSILCGGPRKIYGCRFTTMIHTDRRTATYHFHQPDATLRSSNYTCRIQPQSRIVAILITQKA
jgi:hypothetical protein